MHNVFLIRGVLMKPHLAFHYDNKKDLCTSIKFIKHLQNVI